MVTADHVLLAGTADECRSPMAVRIFRRALQAVDAAGDWDVSSAGTSAAEEQPRQFARPIGDGSSRVRVAPSSAQAAALVDGARKTGARSEPGDDDIADLVGRRPRHVEAAAAGIEAAVATIIETSTSRTPDVGHALPFARTFADELSRPMHVHETASLQADVPTAPRQRLVDIDTARGLAIVLVVFGHIVRANRLRGTPGTCGHRDRDLQLPHAVVHVPHRHRVLPHRRSRHRTSSVPQIRRPARIALPGAVRRHGTGDLLRQGHGQPVRPGREQPPGMAGGADLPAVEDSAAPPWPSGTSSSSSCSA